VRHTGGEREYFLDALRLIAFVVLIVYHVGMVYVLWDFHVKSPNASAALHPWMQLTAPWRMALIFMVSGAATGYLLKRGASWQLLRKRSRFLLLPLLCGVVLIVPPQSYVEVQHKFAYTGSYVDFLKLYFSAYQGFCQGPNCLILPTWNHLWFLPYLWLYTAVAITLLMWRPSAWVSANSIAKRVLAGPFLLIAPAAVLVVLRVFLADRFPITHALIDDPYSHALYGSVFALGLLLSQASDIWPRFATWRWVSLVLALGLWAARVWLAPKGLAQHVVIGALQWLAICAALGFAVQHLNRDYPLRAALNDAVFAVYMLHQTVLILAFQGLQPLRLAPGLEALTVIALTFVISGLVYGLVRSVPALRPWFGLRQSA
jgi:glucans biosynthesis protein C